MRKNLYKDIDIEGDEWKLVFRLITVFAYIIQHLFLFRGVGLDPTPFRLILLLATVGQLFFQKTM